MLVYNSVVDLENNAIPYRVGNIDFSLNSPASVAHILDPIEYELTHWGAKPTIAMLVGFFSRCFPVLRLERMRGILDLIVLDILGSGFATYSLIMLILGMDLTNPVGQSLLAILASAIVAF